MSTSFSPYIFMIDKTTAMKSNTMITIRIITTAGDDEPELALEL